MRVLLIVQFYPPERGAVRYAQDLAKGMNKRGHAVTVLTALPHYPVGTPYPGFGRWKSIRRNEKGIDVIRIPIIMASNTQPVRRAFGFLSFVLSALPWIIRLSRYDVIVSSVPPPTVAILGVLASLIHRGPWIALLRDIEPLRSLTLRGYADTVVGRILIRWSFALFRRADRVVVVHPNERDIIVSKGIGVDRITVIGHGVDVDAFSACSPSADCITIPRRPGNHLALYLGTVGVVHGLLQFIEAAGDSRIRSLPLDIAIVGDGQHWRQCRELVIKNKLDNVHVLPSVSLDDVPAILKQAEILVCSFRDDSDAQLGSKFCEYCAAGKPILVHGRSAAADAVNEIGNGLSCSEGDADGLYKVLRDMTSRKEHWVECGLRGREHARRYYTQNANDELWDGVIRSFESTDRTTAPS